MGSLIQDARYAVRGLAKSPGFTIPAVLILALGIGANVTVFSLVNGVLLKPVPARDPDRLVAVYTRAPKADGGPRYRGSSYPDFLDLRDGAEVFEGVIAYASTPVSLGGDGLEPQVLHGIVASAEYFTLLGVPPALGRGFLPGEDASPGAHPVAVISHGLFERRFGSDPSVVGRAITLNAHPFTVIGVAPEGFAGTEISDGAPPDVWAPISMYPTLASTGDPLNARGARWLGILARLAPGASLVGAQAALDVVSGRLRRDHPEAFLDVDLAAVPASRLDVQARAQIGTVLALLQGVVATVLLIACANVANLLLARAEGRRTEIAVRLSLGAGRGRIVRLLLTESMLLAVPGGAAGLLLALWGSDLMKATVIPPHLDLGLDLRVFAFAAAASAATALVFGVAPALQATRAAIAPVLREGSPGGGASRFRLRNTLAGIQVALSLVLLICAGLLLRSMAKAQSIDPGFDVERLLAASLETRLLGYDEPRALALYSRLLEAVQSLPGVEGASLAEDAPLGPRMVRMPIRAEGRETSPDGRPEAAATNVVWPGFFATMGMPLLRGRDFGTEDRAGTPPSVIINETAARMLWPGEDPLGRRIAIEGDDGLPLQVVGLVRDARYHSLTESPQACLFLPYLQYPAWMPGSTGMTLLVRAASEPASLAEPVRRAIRDLDALIPVARVIPLASFAVDEDARRLTARLLGLFGAIAVLLAAVGLYGLVSHAAGRRTREIGIRIALGARQRDVLVLVVKQGMKPVCFGLAAGLALSLLITRLLASMLFGISPTDAASFAGLTILLAAVAALACWVPARRAARLNPMNALRYE